MNYELQVIKWYKMLGVLLCNSRSSYKLASHIISLCVGLCNETTQNDYIA